MQLRARLMLSVSKQLACLHPAAAKSLQFSTKSFQDRPSEAEKLRKVLRKVPFPVVVITTCSPSDPSIRRGITVSSFSSISLQPEPLVSFCVKLPSRASTLLHEANSFVIQFLSSDQIPHSVAFSSSVKPPAAILEKATRVPDVKLLQEAIGQTDPRSVLNETTDASNSSISTNEQDEPDPFLVLGHRLDPESNIPVLLDTLGAMRCSTHKVLTVGDHEMWISKVEKVLHGSGLYEKFPERDSGQEATLASKENEELQPLLYHDRSYRKVGRRIY